MLFKLLALIVVVACLLTVAAIADFLSTFAAHIRGRFDE